MHVSKKICQELSDREIIEKSLEQLEYFSCLYERYEAQLLRYVQRMGIVAEEEAEDVLQEAFINIWKNLRAFDTSLKLSSWLYRIVHNQAVSCLRKKRSYGKDQKEDFDERRYANLPEESSLEGLETREENDRITHEILDLLPLKYKEVMVLKFLENMSYAEISDVLKIPEGTVAVRINRAKQAFRKISSDKKMIL